MRKLQLVPVLPLWSNTSTRKHAPAMMSFIINYIIFALNRLVYRLRGHDSRQIIHSLAFGDQTEPILVLEAPECGHSGSPLLPSHTCLAEDKVGRLPELRWRAPPDLDVKQYVLLCEDVDAPIPFCVITHGLFFGIPPTTTEALADDIEEDKNSAGRLTLSGWGFVPNFKGTPYFGAAAPLGHGIHRYIYTIIALDEPFHFNQPDKVTRNQIKRALIGKVSGWGQWIGHFERPWLH
ncbi:phosphatidylethanolamine-binding protein [Aspergillus cavernicola]|uniref:Phosphatidylethanolamine-binding protein n=1 Tax=Aspergillus cavernicola TaxID=176166 RepID=A0ABR4HHZ6_9EURO